MKKERNDESPWESLHVVCMYYSTKVKFIKEKHYFFVKLKTRRYLPFFKLNRSPFLYLVIRTLEQMLNSFVKNLVVYFCEVYFMNYVLFVDDVAIL